MPYQKFICFCTINFCNLVDFYHYLDISLVSFDFAKLL